MLREFDEYRVNFSDISLTVLPEEEIPFLFTVIKDGIEFEFLIRRKMDSKKAIVFGSGAYDAKSNLTPPIFQRHKWMEEFEENLIYYNDPTLYLGEMNMGWGVGFKERHYLEELSDILTVIVEKLSVPNENLLFYGSSAGGFMSMMLGALFPEGKVLVNNPQTIVWNYYPGHVNNMVTSCHPKLSHEDFIKKYKDRLNVIEFFKKRKYVPPIKYLQNSASKRDLTHHLNPFILGLQEIGDRYFSSEVKVNLYSQCEMGHSPMGKDETVDYIKVELEKM